MRVRNWCARRARCVIDAVVAETYVERDDIAEALEMDPAVVATLVRHDGAPDQARLYEFCDAVNRLLAGTPALAEEAITPAQLMGLAKLPAWVARYGLMDKPE